MSTVVEKTDFGRGSNPNLVAVANRFQKLPGDGKDVGPTTFSVDPDLVGHFQGMGVYEQRWVIMTHSSSGPRKEGGWFYVWDKKKDTLTPYHIPTSDGFRHPGGLQVVGDYLVVGIEPSADEGLPSLILFYDLREIESRGPKLLANPQIEQTTRSAAAVGLTKVNERYALAVYGGDPNGHVNFYWSNERPLGDNELRFDVSNPFFSFRAHPDGKSTGYDNIALVTNNLSELFLIGLRGDGDLVIKDYADLYQINVLEKEAEHISTRHFVTDPGKISGPFGPHFRFGAGATVTDSNNLQLYCCQRSIALGIGMNLFDKHGTW